jgi:hypothetical protein
MVLILKTLADFWRERLVLLEACIAAGSPESWHAALERRVLAYLLRRHADAPHAEPPHPAEVLDDKSAEASGRLKMTPEVARRLGLLAPGQPRVARYEPESRLQQLARWDEERRAVLEEARQAREELEEQSPSLFFLLWILVLLLGVCAWVLATV